MTKTWKAIVGATLGVALVAGAGAALEAREQGPGSRGGFGRGGPRMGRGGPGSLMQGLRGLDLTEAQRTDVRARIESHKADFEAQATQMRDTRKALNDAASAETFDEGTIRQKAADVAIVEADAAVLRARVHAEVFALLTPEQQQKARDLKAQMEQRAGQMRERREQRRNQRQQRRPQQ